MVDNITQINIQLTELEKEELQNAKMKLSLIDKEVKTYLDILKIGVKVVNEEWQNKFH